MTSPFLPSALISTTCPLPFWLMPYSRLPASTGVPQTSPSSRTRQSTLPSVAEAQLSFRRPDNSTGAVTDPFLTANTEILRPDAASLRAVLLAGLHVSATQALAAPAKLRLSVQVRDSAAAAVTFRQFSLSVAVAVRAYSLTTPDAPPERIANLPKTLTFTNGNAAPLTITAAELAGFRPADHRTELEFVLSSPPYPGLPGETVKFTITS